MRNITIGFRDKGAIFENIVYMQIKNKQPHYVYTNGQEIDLFFDDTLLEVKYHRELVDKQLTAFNDFSATKKLIIRGYQDLNQLEQLD